MSPAIMGFVWGLLVICASIVGSLVGIGFKKITHRTNDSILGFAAGVMLTAAFVGLLPEAFAHKNIVSVLLGIIGVFIGAFFISTIDKFVPHVHVDHIADDNMVNNKGGNRIMLLVIAIAIHNIPEGLATGIAFSDGITSNAFLVGISMLIQKIPEGLIVAVPLIGMGYSKVKTFKISCLVGFMMLPGLILGIIFGSMPQMVTAFFYAFTFGAIVYVISDEIIPESHEHGFEKSATFALIAGVLVVMLVSYLL